MLNKFDWLRRSRTGAELLATLNHFSVDRDKSLPNSAFGAPFSATGRLCPRCKVYKPNHGDRYCTFCKKILFKTRNFALKSQKSIVIWGYVNQIPQQFKENKISNYIHGIYVHDEQRFLLTMQRWKIKQWLQELVIYHGVNLKGLIQIFPTVGEFRHLNMGDYLTWAIHHEANLSLNQLWVRFFTAPQQLINPKVHEQRGMLTFTISEFMTLLEMAEVFRAKLRPDEQRDIQELLNLKDPSEEQFYWGRFIGELNLEAKDMLEAWKIRQWPKNRIKLLYILIDYVVLPQAH